MGWRFRLTFGLLSCVHMFNLAFGGQDSACGELDCRALRLERRGGTDGENQCPAHRAFSTSVISNILCYPTTWVFIFPTLGRFNCHFFGSLSLPVTFLQCRASHIFLE